MPERESETLARVAELERLVAELAERLERVEDKCDALKSEARKREVR